MPTELLTVHEVAEQLRSTPNALYSQRHEGVAPGSLGFLVGRKLLWRQADLDRWLDSKAELAQSATPP
jgi:hypothetical protein